MTIKFFKELEQGSDEWFAARCGMLTASEMKLIITPTFMMADNEKEKQHLFELLAQRVTQYVEPSYIGDHMLRGMEDEILARELYKEKYDSDVIEVGFITNDRWGFTIGYSPDALIGTKGQIECKSRLQKYQAQAIALREMPKDFLIQVQTGLLVTEREWCDYVQYCGGMPMFVLRIYPDLKVHEAIVTAADAFEKRLKTHLENYKAEAEVLFPTERIEYQDILASGDGEEE